MQSPETLSLDVDGPLPASPSHFVQRSDPHVDGTVEILESATWFDFRECITTSSNLTSSDPSSVISLAEPRQSFPPAAIAKRWFSPLDLQHVDEGSIGIDAGFTTGRATEPNELLERSETYQPNPSRQLGSQWLQEPLPSAEFLVSRLSEFS